jgi:hypothetical protein
VKCYVWSIALYGAETWTLRAVDQKHLESFEIWCWTFCVETAFYNGLLKERYKGGIEVTGRQGRRRRKLLDDLKGRRGYSHLKEEALDRTMRRTGFERGFGPVVRQTTK